MASHNLAAAKRLRKELQALERSSSQQDDDVLLRPNSDSILKWTALLKGPPETPYEGGVFQLSIVCGSDYPLAPPTIQFVTKVRYKQCMLNVVCLSYLLTKLVRCFIPMFTFAQEVFAWIY